MQRPIFNNKMDIKIFNSFYWYKSELEQICRENELPTYGTKAELNKYITKYLSGVPANKIKSVRKIRRNNTNSLKSEQITLKTKLLNSGFSLNNEARKFFCNYFKVEKFKFKKSMGIFMREVEKSGNEEADVSDLVNALNSTINEHQVNNDENSYQWNNFVKDFNSDPYSSKFQEKMKVVSILWRLLRDSNKEKKYSRKIVIENMSLINKYKK